ncbi:MAG TPA: protein kinase [Vicinamibacterales bacterium]|nr:protein kinase [Vicinamibacterales bacterium]
MPLAAGTRLGAYEVIDALGAGGMGEVYRARDTKLGRSVAIKVISEACLFDSDHVARFDREAKVLASLNHPRIATLYGMEQSAGRHFLVMELVEGETLADRLRRGAMPVADALGVAQQIAEALEAAHERGVIHRDLKPANVKVTPDERVKVLDFGLAKAIAREQASVDTNSPTLSMRATQIGVILGTAAYMSPEQAKGAPVDHRSDIFSFGVVLFEMLAGRRPFQGDTAADVLASVLVRDADVDSLSPALSPRLRDLLRRCLEKQPKRRWQAIGDVRAEIETIAATPQAPVPSVQPIGATRPLWKRVVPFIGVAALASGLTYLAVWRLRPAASRPAVVRFSLTMSGGQNSAGGAGRRFLAISPDGTRIAYFSVGRLFLRSLSDLEATPIQGVETAQQSTSPAFSPDSQSIAYWASDRTLKRIGVAGGAAVTICPLATNPMGLSWDADGIVFTQGPQILRVSATGGNPELLVTFKSDELVDSPQMLPDGQTVLFTLNPAAPSPDSWDRAAVVVQSLKTGERKTLVSGGADGRYLPTGHLMYALGGTLLALPFDLRQMRTTGQPVPVVEGVRRVTGGASGAAQVTFSNTGSLVYVTGPPGSAATQFDLAFTDRKGSIEPLRLPSASYEYPRVSPDGKQIAFGTEDSKEAVVWVYDLAATKALRRLTFGGRNRFPVWSSDGQRIAFQSDREGDLAVFWQRADGSGVPERLTKPEQGTAHVPDSWSPVGDPLAVTVVKGSSFSLAMHSVREGRTTEFDSVKSSALPTAMFSRDGRWVAYSSSEGGTAGTQVYVQPFPPTGARYQIFAKPADNPHHPLWSPDGKELLYVPRVGAFEAVSVITEPTLAFGNPAPVPRVFPTAAPTTPRTFDITPAGKIVSVIVSGQTSTAAADRPVLHVVLNWFDELNARVPPAR